MSFALLPRETPTLLKLVDIRDEEKKVKDLEGAEVLVTLVEKGLLFAPISPQRVWSTAKGSISPGSFENVGQGALVPVQMRPSVPDSATSRD
jgi:hypothetical protein